MAYVYMYNREAGSSLHTSGACQTERSSRMNAYVQIALGTLAFIALLALIGLGLGLIGGLIRKLSGGK